jgi:hypothetical protein
MNKSRNLRKRFGQPYTSGPVNCLRSSRAHGQCATCGQSPTVLHIPLRSAAHYCEGCCPCCFKTADRQEVSR